VVGKAKRDDFEVIDGQQRINALYEYSEGSFKLFDPIADEEEAQFPSFIKDIPCPWGGKLFDQLPPDFQKQMLETPLSIMEIETDIPNEARDLFIRLQAGMPLNPQEKRDAWPGNFTEYILRLGGKALVAKYPGHNFFKIVMKAKDRNRGEFRQLAAQMAMLYLTRAETGRISEISGEAIDAFYHKHLDFDAGQPNAKRLSQVLDLLTELLRDGKRKKVSRHESISLLLLVDFLMDDYTKSWTTNFATAFDVFRESVAKASKTKYDATPDEYWSKYGLLTRSGTDRADIIERRHQFFVEKMYGLIKPVLKDPTRSFGEAERELIYYRDLKKCQLAGCGTDVKWSDAEIHHIEMHSQGGSTIIDNGALVHGTCHPKGVQAVADFATSWKEKLEKRTNSPAVIPVVAVTQVSTAPQGRRGRPKMTPQEKLVARFIRLGLSPEDARQSLQNMIDSKSTKTEASD
jgi:hypothetical protein